MRESSPDADQAVDAPTRPARGASIVIPLLPVLACLLGGATQKWAEGIVVAILGAYLLARPPRRSLGPLINCLILAFLATALVGFLPASYFFRPAWRTALVSDFGIVLSNTVSPQPWLTVGCCVSLIAGLSWLYLVSTHDPDRRGARFEIRLFAVGILLIAAASIAFYFAHKSPPFWINERRFGPFPNRNQTANLFGIASIVVLACGQDDIRQGRKRWVFWLLALGLLIAALILNFSRAGLLILIIGSGAWMAVVAMRQGGSAARIGVGVSILLLLLTSLLVFGGETLERFHLRSFGKEAIAPDYRWLIFEDARDLIRASPWCGIGLGNFESVFAIFREASIADTRVLHPESDWLWMWSEMGWPAIVIALVAAGLLLRYVAPLPAGSNQRFRLAALIGALLFALHGLVDVAGHRVGTAMSAVFLLGMALHRPLRFKSSRVVPVLFRTIGLGLVACGVLWVWAARSKAPLAGGVGVANAKELASIANRGRNFEEAVNLTNTALQWAPLDWQLYFLRAIGEIGARRASVALDDFRRARFLEPNAFEVPLEEGNVWITSRPLLAVTAWREALRRAGRQRPQVYGNMLNKAALQNPEVAKMLEDLGLTEHELAMAYLARVNGEQFTRALARFREHDPDLQTLTPPEKYALFALWSERGDLDELTRVIHQHPEWTEFAWQGVAKQKAKQGDFRTAYELAEKHGDQVALPRVTETLPLDQLQRNFYSAPSYGTGYALYREQMKAGRVDDALNTVRRYTEQVGAPSYFHFLEAQAWAAKENWERAWAAWEAFQRARSKNVTQ